MSLPITAAGVASAFPAMNVHAHGHGHKKGLESATDSTSEPDAPTGSTQSLFGNLLDSMEQVIGAHSANAPTQPPGSTRPSGSAAHAAAAAQSAAATSSMGDAAKALLSTIGTALKFLA